MTSMTSRVIWLGTGVACIGLLAAATVCAQDVTAEEARLVIDRENLIAEFEGRLAALERQQSRGDCVSYDHNRRTIEAMHIPGGVSDGYARRATERYVAIVNRGCVQRPAEPAPLDAEWEDGALDELGPRLDGEASGSSIDARAAEFRLASRRCDNAAFRTAQDRYIRELAGLVADAGGRGDIELREQLLREQARVHDTAAPACEGADTGIWDAVAEPEPTIASAPAPSVQADDPLGVEWSESESGWTGRWIRRGTSNTFDAVWNRAGRDDVRAVLTIDVSGNRVTIHRPSASDDNSCQYEGVLSGNSVSGSYRCDSGSGRWRATIRNEETQLAAAAPASPAAADVAVSSAASQPASCSGFAGLWDVNNSTYELTQDGDEVTGTYGGGPGKIRGRVSADGRTFTGEESSWVEPDKWLDYVIRFVLSEDGQSFTGTTRSPDLTQITVINGRCRGTADLQLTAMLEAIVAADSGGWRTNRYLVGTIRNGRVFSGDRESGNFSARGEYTYNVDRPGWVIARFRRGQLECLQYHDIGETCRPPH